MTTSKKVSDPSTPGSSPDLSGLPTDQEETTPYLSPEKNADGDPMPGPWDIYEDIRFDEVEAIRKCPKCKFVTHGISFNVQSYKTEDCDGQVMTTGVRDLNIVLCSSCGHFKTMLQPLVEFNNA